MAVKKEATIDVVQITRDTLTAYVVGRTPLICNAMNQKIRQDLLFPPGKKNAAEKASTLKHEPVAEFRRSCYKSVGDDQPTRILLPATAFKSAIRSAALDMPGAAKSQIGRLLYVEGEYISIYGTPEVFMRVTRSADMNRTPDVRTRAILREWACRLELTFITPLLKAKTVGTLLAASGIMRGVGDFRVEKGAGNYGCFDTVPASSKSYARIVKAGGRKAQDAALLKAASYDSETEELLTWFNAEVLRRGMKVA